jgi:hypothetical protein
MAEVMVTRVRKDKRSERFLVFARARLTALRECCWSAGWVKRNPPSESLELPLGEYNSR